MLSTITPAAAAAAPDPLTDTVAGDELIDQLNAVLAATDVQEGRRPLRLNGHGQWCTSDVYGSWTPHPNYQAAYQAAHAGQVS